MYCPNCGQQQPDNAIFCNNCGKPLQATPTAPQQPVIIQTTVSSDPVVPIAQQQPRIVCPRCRGTNVNIQAINNVHLENKRHGCAWWIFVGWWWVPIKWLFFTLPALIIKIFKPKKQKVVNTVHSFAVCQSCGNRWML